LILLSVHLYGRSGETIATLKIYICQPMMGPTPPISGLADLANTMQIFGRQPFYGAIHNFVRHQ
jgi:hypothetical protein